LRLTLPADASTVIRVCYSTHLVRNVFVGFQPGE